MWFQRVVHSIVTFGEDPEVSGPRGAIWDAHLDELRIESGAGAWLSELLRGPVAHLWWRAVVSSRQSSLSVGLACILLAVSTLGLVASSFNDFVSDAAAIHSSLAFLTLGIALSINPWVLSWRRIAPACLVAASGPLHLAVTNQSTEWFDYALVASQVSAVIGLTYMGVSGIRTRTPFGATRFGLTCVVVGSLLAPGAQFLWALQSGDLVCEVSSDVFTWMAAFAGLRVADLWSMQVPPGGTTHRLAGGGRQRHRQPQNVHRSPLFLRSVS